MEGGGHTVARIRRLALPLSKVDIRLHGKVNSKLPWRKAGQPSHLVDVVVSDQQVVNKELSLWEGEGATRVEGVVHSRQTSTGDGTSCCSG